MTDLIRRADVLAYPIRIDHYDKEHGNRHFVLGIESVMEYVESLPSAEAVQGEWINREYCQVDEDAYEVATCSNCKSEITIEYPHDNYCPNCGARMKGGDDE